MLEGEPVGFGSLAGNEKIDLLHVHPDAARLGVATTLVDAFEKLVAARGATTLGVDASENATAFFAARNYIPLARNTVLTGDEWLANTSMQKILAAAKKV